MNRQQRRNAAKLNAARSWKAAHATDVSIEKQMTELEAEIRLATQNHFMGVMYCVFILVLRKVCGYGPVGSYPVYYIPDLDPMQKQINRIKNEMHYETRCNRRRAWRKVPMTH